MTTTNTTLARYAKAIAAVVEAGGPELPQEIKLFNERLYFVTPEGNACHERRYIIPPVEKYVREDVVVWADGEAYIDFEEPHRYGMFWTFRVGLNHGSTDDPTEAHIAFLEAIASVVAGEKGEVAK